MKVEGAHLTYCTNIHPGERWPEVLENLRTRVLEVKQRVSPGAPFGVGLRLSNAAALELAEPGELERFRDFLAQSGSYVFTLNGFPYGPFHGEPVKSAVYRPDWRHPARADYTARLARLLAALLPEGQQGTISTVPGGFKPELGRAEEHAAVARALVAATADLVRLEREQGKRIQLALEPEPCCLLETTSETVRFFEEHLLSRAALGDLARELAITGAEAERALRAHLGVCLDACHAAVEFEAPDAAVDTLLGAGLSIGKIQLSAGLRLPSLSAEALDALRAYDEPVYLHQVVAERADGELLRYVDLPEALASREALAAREWRVHFHVPLYRERLERFVNTQPFLVQLLARQRRAPISEQLEVETYTWDVLPPEQRAGGVVASIARELGWVLEQLA